MKLIRCVAVLAATALLALPTAAHADSAVGLDAKGDVQYVTSADTSTAVAAPDRTQGDISAVKITHGANKVRVLLRFRELNRAGFIEHDFYFRTASRVRTLSVESETGSWSGRATMRNGRGTKVRCNLTRTIDYSANTVLVVVPRTCLGDPRWVRVGAGTISTYDGSKIFYDDGGRPAGPLGDNLTLSPRVYR